LTPTPTPSSAAQEVARFHLTVEGSGRYPRATLEAPYRTWTPYKHFALTNDAANASFGISLWDVGKVARNPCHSIGGMFDPGPTVGDLVGGLQEQSLRQATKATSVRLAGYSGMHLQWSVPAHWHVVQHRWDVPEFAGCDVQPGGHREFVSWESRGNTGERWEQMAGQVDQLWVLDVTGQRLVVDAWYSPNATPEQIAAEDQIVNSLRLSTRT
jgi:hypothetical protein